MYLSLALSLSFLCSVLEAVLLSTPMSFITMKEQSHAKFATLLKKFKSNPDKPIAAILSLNTIAHTVGASGVGAEAVKVFGEEYFGIISAILTILILVLSEIIPKSVGTRYWRSLTLPIAPILRVMIYLTYPLVLLSELITKMVSSKHKSLSVSREEVSAMVTVGTEEGVFEKEEQTMLQNLIQSVNVHARSIMTPSVVVASASAQMTLRDFYKDAHFRPYSRIPIYDETKEFITGYVLRQNILEKLAEDNFDMRLKDISRPILAFPEDEEVSTIWERLKEEKEHISIIVDEYGCLRGIVTMEDVIETMLGFEIVDENDMVEDMQILARERWAKLRAEN